MGDFIDDSTSCGNRAVKISLVVIGSFNTKQPGKESPLAGELDMTCVEKGE